MINISRESEINLINILIDQDIISGKDLAAIMREAVSSQPAHVPTKQLVSRVGLQTAPSEQRSLAKRLGELEVSMPEDIGENCSELPERSTDQLSPAVAYGVRVDGQQTHPE